MKKFGIFYGSMTGTTARVAQEIAKGLGADPEDVHNVADTAPHVLGDYETVVLGTSTWGDGEVESDWYDFLDGAQGLSLKGHKMAFFGCGDESMTETFCNGVGYLYNRMRDTGAELIGQYPATAYEFNHSDAIVDGSPVGLLLDDVNKPALTDERITAWTHGLRVHA